MKKYFLHNGIESSGPFDLEELKAQKITRTTPVWYEGLENWKTAGEIEALGTIFIVIPPPIKPIRTSSRIRTKKIAKNQKILGLSRNTFFAVSGILILIIFNIVFNLLQENRSDELEIKNRKTEIGNYQFEQQQKEIEEQKIQLVLQQKIEAERISREQKQKINTRLIEIEDLIATNTSLLEEAKNKLEDANSFKLLRTANEKAEQVSLLQNKIESYKNEISTLKTESHQLNLELEKIQ